MIVEYNGVFFALENMLIKKLDLLIDRVTISKQEQNAYIANHGDPGEGKTNSSLAEAAYVKLKTNRDIHLFFGTSAAIEFAKNTENKIIIVDEPSLDNLSTDQMTRVAKNFLRLINMSRIKRHFTIINLAKFWRFPKDLVCDALKGMIHMDSKDGKDPGRFKYIRGKFLEPLYNDYHKFGKKRYAHYMSFGGRMPLIKKEDWIKFDIFINNKPNCTYEDYEKLKHEAISSIGEAPEKVNKKEELYIAQMRKLKAGIVGFGKKYNVPMTEIAKYFQTGVRTVQSWAIFDENRPISLGNVGFEGVGRPTINNTVAKEEKTGAMDPEIEGYN